MSRPESQIHDAGVNRSRERQYNRQVARSGSLSVPALPAEHRYGRQALTRLLTPPAGTRFGRARSSVKLGER